MGKRTDDHSLALTAISRSTRKHRPRAQPGLRI